ncbi:MAG: protease modulator HflC [Proteobacteria bacterium]|nr:protease modulator HflC [Desulfobulbaceae bacterium]MBU4152358.1 protease modulator HflC [Pseudomonadota bacterium]MDP2106184.1 protease modulator HflC [Desulfobulbaceae bacterium]
MQKIIRTVMIGLVAAAALTAWNSFYIVPEGFQAVVTQFGAPVGEPIVTSGLHLKTPFVQEITFFDKKIQIWDGDPNQIPTKDKTFVYVDVTARWRISNALIFLQAVKTETRAHTLLDDIVDSTVRDMVNKNNLVEMIRSSDWVMGEGSKARGDDEPIVMGRDKLTELIHKTASAATVKYGIELVDVMFKRVNYIDTVQNKVFERMISERKRIAAEKRSQGEGQKAEILGKVERELKSVTSSARQEAEQIKGKADAEASRIYSDAYNKDPEFYAFFKTLESYEQTVGINTKLVIPAGSEYFRFMNVLQ